MRGEASSDVLKVWLYAAASVFLGSWITPLLYNAGKALAEVSDAKATNGPLEWLANVCRKADLPSFFVAGLILAGVLLFLPFIEWLRGGRGPASSPRGKTWSIRLPEGASRGVAGGQPLARNPSGPVQFFTGFVCVAVLFLVIAGALILTGAFSWKTPGENMGRLAARTLTSAIFSAFLLELLFRGIAMGIFLRAMRPAAALATSTALFALLMFLQPPPGVNVVDPDAAGVGFELLGKIISQFAEPKVLLGTFAPLLALGAVLGYARWQTASLWLPIGLHAGWIFSSGLLASLATSNSGPDSAMWVICGTSMKQGVAPLLGILLAGVLTNHLASSRNASHPS